MGGACSLVPWKKLKFFPCSPKISQDVPLNSLLLSSPVPKNYIACFFNPKKYSLMFPKAVPNIFQFLMVSYLHNFYLAIHSRDNHPASTKCLFRLLDECYITSCQGPRSIFAIGGAEGIFSARRRRPRGVRGHALPENF